MTTEKTLKIDGKDVFMRYCLAAETGYERLAGRSAEVFNPQILEYGDDGKPSKVNPPLATTDDYIQLAFAAIVAAYTKRDEDIPITSDYLLYDAQPEEIATLIAEVTRLRREWYHVPEIVKSETKPAKPNKQKNA